MRFFSPIGYYPEERKIKNHFTIDLHLEIEENQSFKNDDLSATVNYQEVYCIVNLIMQKEQQLLEFTAQNILSEIKKFFPQIKKTSIKLCKLHPPIGGQADKVCISLSA